LKREQATVDEPCRARLGGGPRMVRANYFMSASLCLSLASQCNVTSEISIGQVVPLQAVTSLSVTSDPNGHALSRSSKVILRLSPLARVSWRDVFFPIVYAVGRHVKRSISTPVWLCRIKSCGPCEQNAVAVRRCDHAERKSDFCFQNICFLLNDNPS